MSSLPQLRRRWVAGSALLLVALLLLALASSYAVLRERSLAQGAEQLLRDQRLLAAGLDQVFARAEQRAREMGEVVRSAGLQGPQLIRVLAAKLLNDGELVQFGVLLEPDNPVAGAQRFAVSVTFGHAGIAVEDFVATGYTYWNMPWYERTRQTPEGWWSDPYFNDAAGGQDTVTFDYPLHAADQRFIGMLSVSVSLERVAEITDALGWNHDGRLSDFLLVDAHGKILRAADAAIERAYALEGAAARSGAPLPGWMRGQRPGEQVHREAARGGQTLVQVPLPRLGWRVAAAVADQQILGALQRNVLLALLLGLAVCSVLALLIGRLAQRFGLPLLALADAAERLAGGQFDRPIQTPPNQPLLGRLARGLEQARRALNENLGGARASSDARQRIEGQLQLAAELQRSLLPADRVFFGRGLQAQVSGLLRPAASVAGDFYGFVSPAPGMCVFYAGDVKGRGVEAVLFMSRLAALLPAVIRQGGTPSAVIAAVAEQLLQGDDAGWQVELLVGRLELAGGDLLLASAAYPTPLLLGAGGQQLLALQAGPALTRDGGSGWPDNPSRLQAGERLLLYSDGVCEAADAQQQAFGLQRLQVEVERALEAAPERLLGGVLDAVAAHGERAQADDLALLLVSVVHRD